MSHSTIHTDVLVIGTGIAGLSAALQIAPSARVTVVAKEDPRTTNTQWAQGGIAAALAAEDSIESHIADTLACGGGLCDAMAVRTIVAEAPRAIQQLADWGVDFSRGATQPWDLTQEGGHAHRRIVHAADRTGQAIAAALLARAQQHPQITLLPHHCVVDLITERSLAKARGEAAPAGAPRVWGAYILDRETGQIRTCAARVTCLASGGAGKVYLYTTNPDVATGDGLAIAYRAGATIANLEFVQFHPTCLYHPQAKSFLISEAVRGEGGQLRLITGEAFMPRYDARGDLATRDIVARAIDRELKRHGHDYVHLDISHRPATFVRERFPQIYATCLRLGIDITRQPIPVVPAAHYFCGGVATDLQARTTLPQLLACGEVAHTGLHGANRLASNSLMESVVMAQRAAATASALLATMPACPPLPPWDTTGTTDSDEEVMISHNWDEVRRTMWNYVGIVRSDKRLARAAARIRQLQEEIHEYYWNFTITNDLLELRNIALVAELLIRAAAQRHESRGLHYNIDHPQLAATPTNTLLQREP